MAEIHKKKGGLWIFRPDSGDPVEAIMMALVAGENAFGATKNKKGYKVLNGVGMYLITITTTRLNINTISMAIPIPLPLFRLHPRRWNQHPHSKEDLRYRFGSRLFGPEYSIWNGRWTTSEGQPRYDEFCYQTQLHSILGWNPERRNEIAQDRYWQNLPSRYVE